MTLTSIALAALFSPSLVACGGGGDEVVRAQSDESGAARALSVTHNIGTRVLSFRSDDPSASARISVNPTGVASGSQGRDS